jgi:hypothetical protein
MLGAIRQFSEQSIQSGSVQGSAVGDQSWEEMMVGTVDVAIDAKTNPIELYRPKRASSPGNEPSRAADQALDKVK